MLLKIVKKLRVYVFLFNIVNLIDSLNKKFGWKEKTTHHIWHKSVDSGRTFTYSS
jgi:hypothetical protein